MLFIDNKYTRWYYSIVNNATSRTTSEYTEKHHIIPRSFFKYIPDLLNAVSGNPDSHNNIVLLTAREHFICHWLLTKMVSGKLRYAMVHALSMMRTRAGDKRYHTKITARIFALYREEFSKSASELGKIYNSSLTSEQRKSKHGRPGELNGFFGKKHPAQLLDQIKESHIIQRANKLTCEKCGVKCDVQNYSKHHGDKCGKGATGIRGKRWFTDGINSFLLLPDDPKIKTCSLKPGRSANGLGRPKRES
jgi:hypothetical protein